MSGVCDRHCMLTVGVCIVVVWRQNVAKGENCRFCTLEKTGGIYRNFRYFGGNSLSARESDSVAYGEMFAAMVVLMCPVHMLRATA